MGPHMLSFFTVMCKHCTLARLAPGAPAQRGETRLVVAHINYWSSFWFTRAPPRGAHRDRVSAPLKKQKQYKNRTPPKKKQNTQETPGKNQKPTKNNAKRCAAPGGRRRRRRSFLRFFFVVFDFFLVSPVLFFFGGLFLCFCFFRGAPTLSLSIRLPVSRVTRHASRGGAPRQD